MLLPCHRPADPSDFCDQGVTAPGGGGILSSLGGGGGKAWASGLGPRAALPLHRLDFSMDWGAHNITKLLFLYFPTALTPATLSCSQATAKRRGPASKHGTPSAHDSPSHGGSSGNGKGDVTHPDEARDGVSVGQPILTRSHCGDHTFQNHDRPRWPPWCPALGTRSLSPSCSTLVSETELAGQHPASRWVHLMMALSC